jgi:hypothetical protein
MDRRIPSEARRIWFVGSAGGFSKSLEAGGWRVEPVYAGSGNWLWRAER